ncbi:MAG: hypothetical protein R3E02_09695 [Blastomonas sp.]
MSRKLMLSACLSTIMMAGFAINSYAHADDAASELAECRHSKLDASSRASDNGGVPVRLLLSSLAR